MWSYNILNLKRIHKRVQHTNEYRSDKCQIKSTLIDEFTSCGILKNSIQNVNQKMIERRMKKTPRSVKRVRWAINEWSFGILDCTLCTAQSERSPSVHIEFWILITFYWTHFYLLTAFDYCKFIKYYSYVILNGKNIKKINRQQILNIWVTIRLKCQSMQLELTQSLEWSIM